MKKLFFLFALCFYSVSVFSCEDFSGTFYNDNSGEKIFLAHAGCDKITIGNVYGKNEYIADGAWRVFYQSARLLIERRAAFVGNSLEFDELSQGSVWSDRVDITYTKTTKGLTKNVKTFNPKGDLVLEDNILYRRIRDQY